MGYEIAHNGKCITVFSAPNYCDTMGNKGAYIILNGKDMKPKFEVYEAVPHPDVKVSSYFHIHWLIFNSNDFITFYIFQPMMYANSLMSLIM